MVDFRNTRTILLAAAAAGLVLTFDLMLPSIGFGGVAGAVPYAALVLPGLWLPAPRHVCLLALAATALTVVGYLLSPPGAEPPVVLANRGLALFAIWITAGLVAGRKQTEQALGKAKARAERYLEVSEAMIVALDSTGQITAINRRGCDILLQEERDLLGRDWFETCLPPEEREEMREVFDAMMAGRIPGIEYYENEVIDRDGKRRYMAWHNTLIRDDSNATSGLGGLGDRGGRQGAIRGTLSSGLDITDRKQAEAALIAAKQDAETANRAKTDFLSSMSHELRTPLNAVLGFAELMKVDQANPLSASQEERVGYILKGGNHLLYLIDQVLELNKIETGHLSLTLEETNPIPLIEECLSLVRARAAEAEVRLIDRTGHADLPVVWTDSARLKQVLINLLSNAVKYNRRHGQVTLSATAIADDMLRLIVNDTGLGIPQDRHADLFTPFDRLGREAAGIEGTGIGLSISKEIMERLGGRIGFASEENTGSSFWIDVPKYRDAKKIFPSVGRIDRDGMIGAETRPGDDDTKAGHEAGPGAEKAAGGSTRKVLYLEDNRESLRLMQAILEQLPGIELLSADTAGQGFELALRHAPALIIIDLNLRGVDGIALLERLRQSDALGDIPAVAVSAAPHPSEVKAGLDAGFKAYITKPLDVRKTLRIVSGLLQIH